MIKYDPAERAELLPDGRYLVTDQYRAPRVISPDGSVFEVTPSEVAALRALLSRRWGVLKKRASQGKNLGVVSSDELLGNH